MAKTIIREIIITLLLCLAIILILSVLLYGYVPTNKVMPEKVSYTTPENLKEELNKNDGVNESEVILTYEVDPTDLDFLLMKRKKIQQQLIQQIMLLLELIVQQVIIQQILILEIKKTNQTQLISKIKD